MRRSLILVCFILVCLSIIPTIHADVIDPDQKEIPLYYQITNINSYPDYVFLLHGNPSPSFIVLNSSEFNFYKLSTASIYAVEKSNFNQSELEQLNSTQMEEYFTNNSDVIPSNLNLNGSYGTVNQVNSLSNVIIELEITSLNQTHLEIKKNRIIYVYQDGTRKTADYKDQNTTPQPDTSLTGGEVIWYFILPLIAAIAILLLFLYRRSH